MSTTGTNWQQLSSSNLKRCAYDIETEELKIQFQSGKVYSYQGVPASVYNGLLEADSPGRYFIQSIKDIYA